MTVPAPPALAGLVGCVALLTLAGGWYQARYRLPRPPIGRYTYPDVVILFAVVVAAPLVYVRLPRWVVAAIFGVVLFFLIQFALRPLAGRAAWAVATVLCTSAVVAAALGARGVAIAVTDVLLAIGVVAVSALWTQSGMRAGHVALFATLLAGYDLVATQLTGLMRQFFDQVAGLPFAPVLLLTTGRSPVGIGLGDLLLVVVYPLAATRSFGRRAGVVAGVVAVAVTGGVATLFGLGLISSGVPLLTLLGPAIVVQYCAWRAIGGDHSGSRTSGLFRVAAHGSPSVQR
jgi:hypothetical protein